jgi:hypothetical protein
VEYSPEQKATTSGGSFSTFLEEATCAALKVAPTVFDRASAICSAALIGACGGFTLFLRYYGIVFLD